jgi:hypothetical protein
MKPVHLVSSLGSCRFPAGKLEGTLLTQWRSDYRRVSNARVRPNTVSKPLKCLTIA